MQALIPRRSDAPEYSVFVKVENRGFPDHESLSIPHSQVSIAWKFIRSHRCSSDTGTDTKPIIDVNTWYESNEKYPFELFTSNNTCNIISNMLSRRDIPFPLDRLRWRKRYIGNTEPLEDVEAMTRKIVLVVKAMASQAASHSGLGRLDILVTVEKEIILPQTQYQLMQLEDRVEDLRQGLASLRQGYVDDFRRLQGLQDLELRLLTERNQLFRRAAAALLTEEAAVRESLDEAAVLLRPKPASKASVEALEKLVFQGGGGECVFCLEKMVSGDQVTRLPCSHVFHGDCVVEWLKLGHTCPVCRFKLPTD
ncbi:hypothetical protein PRUPE_5G083200 [Prunus persica]|uniref:RING-type E3 ubiquitin transferase n=1 Tax=Prunus persica TaxID=3760 RepID=A0A251P702_PRUPE|nr:hypothetical protein PRUPE_5G083200 [Prunus persica]